MHESSGSRSDASGVVQDAGGGSARGATRATRAKEAPGGLGAERPPAELRRWRRYLARAWRGRCPRCGEGSLWRTRLRLAERCPACGLVYRRESGAMTGQMYLSAVVTELFAAGLVIAVFLATDWSAALAIAVALPLVVAFSYWFLPRSMAAWVVVEFLTDIGNREPWIEGEG